MLTGGCFCGRVRYQADGPPLGPTLCHCVDCRKVAGAPMVAWFSVRPDGFRITAGEPVAFASSAGVTRQFCGHCGTPLTFRSRATPDEIDITTCSLDDPELVPPADHTWTQQRLSWVEPGDRRPRYARGHDGPPQQA
jgi:hypothetical protein